MTVARTEPMGSELAISAGQSKFSPAQRVALAHMGADKAPDEDVDVFFHVCQRTGLDPFARQIYLIGRDESVLVKGEWKKVPKFTIQTGIDGFRLVARRVADDTGQELGYGDMLWCGRDGVWRDVWLGEPLDLYAAKATVFRAGKPFTHVALLREYAQTKRNGELTNMWATKGANQLAKCAEAGALRKAFPQDLGGVYVDAEMERVAAETAADQVVGGSRDWFADAAGATSDDDLRTLWREASRAHMLTPELQAFIRSCQERLKAPPVVQASAPVRVAREVIDERTGEVVLDAEVVEEGAGEGAHQPVEGGPGVAPSSSSDVVMVKRATVIAIQRELARCGVGANEADSYLGVLGIPRDRVTDLTQVEAEELLVAVRGLDRDKLAELVADMSDGVR